MLSYDLSTVPMLFCSFSHLINIDGNGDDDMQQVSKCQAADQYIWPVMHTLILIDDPQKSGIPNNTDNENQAGHHCVDVLESVSDFCGSGAHGWQAAAGHGAVGPHRTLHISFHEPLFLGNGERLLGHLFLWLQLSTGHKYVDCQSE